MARSPKKFAELLTEAVRTIAARENKPIALVQDELAIYALGRKSGTAVEYWRKGHIPGKQSDVEKLGRAIVEQSNLEREWLEPFLISAGHPNPSRFCDALFPGPLPVYLPNKPYRELMGRDTLVRDIMAALSDPEGRWIVAIDGMGGIGKTALAHEIVEQCLKEHHFDAVVWASAARTEADHRDSTETDALTFEMVLDTIVRHLDALDILRLGAAQKEVRIQNLLRSRRIVIVLDNLETAGEPQNEIARRLRPLLGPSKALLISRHRFTGELYAIHLTGLDEEPALAFIHQEAEEKRISRVKIAQPGELEQIVEATGGSPLAMKLVVGQLGHLPLEIVLEHLQEVRSLESRTDEDEYIRFYKFIYFPSWQLLSRAGKRLLISMAHFAPGVGGTFEAIKATSDLPDDVLNRTINELWRLSFLEAGELSNLKQIRYYLHALTQYFVLSDIVQILR